MPPSYEASEAGTLDGMDWIDGTYFGAVNLAGALARAVKPLLPPGWRLRLEAHRGRVTAGPWIWVHAVSVGEILLAEGLIRRLRAAGHGVHVTSGTPAGLDLLARRAPQWDSDPQGLTWGAFPLDDAAGLVSFLDEPPAVFIALETELWPNLFRELDRRGIPILLVNGRLTSRTRGRGAAWMRRTASRIRLVAARDPESAKAFQELGAPRVVLGGNLKADVPPPRALGESWQGLREAWRNDPVVVVGNTVEDEESLVLDAWREARRTVPGLRMILAPRQPRRFEAVAQLLSECDVAFQRASQWPSSCGVWEATDLLLLDTLGDLAAAYGEGQVALVGGGWTWHGGHNPLEAVQWGIPTGIGPGYDNFTDLVDPLLEAQLLTVLSWSQLAGWMVASLQVENERGARRWGAVALPEGLAGTLSKTYEFLKEFLPDGR